MFSNNEQPKLDWMYKGPNALVDREAYLLGRTVDKTLEQLNDEEKKTTNNLVVPTKNHVEHECIPPSIRDYNKIVKSEQVDLQAKLQEDPLVIIKRQEEETRKQFLQNPIQLKKLQEALQAQVQKKKKGKKDKLDKKLKKKLKLLTKHLYKKDGYKKLKICNYKSSADDEKILDTILMHKFNSLKTKLSEDDLQNILVGRFSESEESEKDIEERKKSIRPERMELNHSHKICSGSDSDDFRRKLKLKHSKYKRDHITEQETSHNTQNYQKKKLSEEEKEARRKSMMQLAAQRTEDSSKSYRKYKEQNVPEIVSHYGEEFIRKELLKSANSSSVADRIKSNVNNIQRSKFSMESNFLK